MRKSSSGHASQAIERILELSADAQIARRTTAKDTSPFHNLTGAIAAYGNALALLTALRQQEEFYAVIGNVNFPSALQRLPEARRQSICGVSHVQSVGKRW
jgi:hypothetical protein